MSTPSNYVIIDNETLSNIATILKNKLELSSITTAEFASRLNDIMTTSEFISYRSTITNLDVSSICKTGKIGGAAFNYCPSLKSVIGPDVIKIGGNAFAGCSNLSYISIPNCSSIGNSAFANCSSLSSISIPNCSYIGEYGFIACYSLTSISLPNCSYIGDSAFTNCSKLESIYVLSTSYLVYLIALHSNLRHYLDLHI